MDVLISVCQRKRSNKVYREGFIIRNWLICSWRLTSTKSTELMFQFEYEGWQCILKLEGATVLVYRHQAKEFSLSGVGSVCYFFFFFLLSADWMGPTHIIEDNLLYTVYQFKYYKKYPHRKTQKNV